MAKTAADMPVERLIDWGVDTGFGLPGDGINGILMVEGLMLAQVEGGYKDLTDAQATASYLKTVPVVRNTPEAPPAPPPAAVLPRSGMPLLPFGATAALGFTLRRHRA
ncbi:MAG: hypothetical protein M1531_10080 [Chloroflexi bacterium]|nr:hypothetical protein [Chloroflexota bacterium]